MEGEHSEATSPEAVVNTFEGKKEIVNGTTDIRTKADQICSFRKSGWVKRSDHNF